MIENLTLENCTINLTINICSGVDSELDMDNMADMDDISSKAYEILNRMDDKGIRLTSKNLKDRFKKIRDKDIFDNVLNQLISDGLIDVLPNEGRKGIKIEIV